MSKAEQLQQYEKELVAYEDKLKKAQEGIEDDKRRVDQYASQTYGQGEKQNLVEWELDFKPELEDIGRSLRCDVLKVDEKGNEYWVRNPDVKRVFLNDLGVADVLRKIILLVNKNKVLSNYTIDEIKKRVQQIGHELRALIYNNYEAYEIDNEYKMNNYPNVVMDILSIIEDAYRRAMSGETHKGLAEQRIVTQSDSINNKGQQMIPQQQQKSAKWYSPSSWSA